MRRVALKIAYIGSNFHGYQRQPNYRTVEGELLRVFKETNIIEDTWTAHYSVAGRTDKGVHSTGNVISFITDTRLLEIAADDFLWWTAIVRGVKYKRLDKLFNDTEKKDVIESVKPEIYKVACGIKKDSVVTNIEKFEGCKKDTIAFVNKIFAKMQIKSMFKANIVFCVNYKYDDDLNDANNWLTMYELCDKGVFVK